MEKTIIEVIFISSILLFFIIYLSVRLAIRPLINMKDEIDIVETELDSALVKLRDIGIINGEELDKIAEIYDEKTERKNRDKQYVECEEILKEMKNLNCFNDDEYLLKLEKLNEYFKVS